MVSDGFSSFEVDFDQNNVGCLKHLHHAAPPLGMPCHQNPRQTINQPVLEKKWTIQWLHFSGPIRQHYQCK
jgi:hypothetical protein